MSSKCLFIMCLVYFFNCRTANPVGPSAEDGKIEELWTIMEQKEIKGTEEICLGYTTASDLIIEYPNQIGKIRKWIKENPGSDEENSDILKKPRFIAIMQSDAIVPDPEQVFRLEVEKLWRIIKIKKKDRPNKIGLGHTTRTHVLKVFPDHTKKIFEWIDENRKSDKILKLIPFIITKTEFEDIIQSLTLYPEEESNRALTLQKLEELNNNLKEKPPTFQNWTDEIEDIGKVVHV